MRHSRKAGMTLIEVTIAITLLSLLFAGHAMAIRVGLQAFTKVDAKLADIRKVTGAQNILHQELEGLIPVLAMCGDQSVDTVSRRPFSRGANLRADGVGVLAATGMAREPQCWNCFVIPGEEGGVRLVMNEELYTGYKGAAHFCTGFTNDGTAPIPQFTPVVLGQNHSFWPDQLAYCRFSYFYPGSLVDNKPPAWVTTWAVKGCLRRIRIEMAPMHPDHRGFRRSR